MNIVELLITSVALAMDAFAVSVCKGLSVRELKLKHALLCGAYFGIFQALMPLIGYLLGSKFISYIEKYDHWIAFILLAFIGSKMAYESFSHDEHVDSDFRFVPMLTLAIATSIDALAVGIALACLETAESGFNDALFCCLTIGVITFLISAVGVKIGNIFGIKFKAKAELAGGIILVLIGVKILVEALFFS